MSVEVLRVTSAAASIDLARSLRVRWHKKEPLAVLSLAGTGKIR